MTGAQLVALVGTLTDAEHEALRLALRKRETPEAAAASAAYVGHGFPCTATPKCGRMLRTAKGASSHDPKHDGWHNAG